MTANAPPTSNVAHLVERARLRPSAPGDIAAVDALGCRVECEPVWSERTPGQLRSSEVVSNGLVFVAGKGRLFAFARRGDSGSTTWMRWIQPSTRTPRAAELGEELEGVRV